MLRLQITFAFFFFSGSALLAVWAIAENRDQCVLEIAEKKVAFPLSDDCELVKTSLGDTLVFEVNNLLFLGVADRSSGALPACAALVLPFVFDQNTLSVTLPEETAAKIWGFYCNIDEDRMLPDAKQLYFPFLPNIRDFGLTVEGLAQGQFKTVDPSTYLNKHN